MNPVATAAVVIVVLMGTSQCEIPQVSLFYRYVSRVSDISVL